MGHNIGPYAYGISHTRISVWDVPYAYGPIYAYGAEHSYEELESRLSTYICCQYLLDYPPSSSSQGSYAPSWEYFKLNIFLFCHPKCYPLTRYLVFYGMERLFRKIPILRNVLLDGTTVYFHYISLV